MKRLRISLNTLTPLWTGDADGNSEKIKLTGIIGSLRWWFEALVRGMGYYACDITSEKSDKKCKVEIKKPEDVLTIYEKICPVCFIFGTTGWKSRFLLNIENDNLQKPYNGKVIVKLNDGRGWHYEAGLMGEATLAFQYDKFYLKENLKFSDVFPSTLKILLYLIQEYGMLGAKTSMGYGVVKFKLNGNDLSIAESDWEKFEKYLELFKKNFKKEVKYLPNLKDMFFVKFKVDGNFYNILQNIKPFYRFQDAIVEDDINKWKDSGWIITSPVVRKTIRGEIKSKFNSNNDLRHFLMGKVKGKNSTFSAIQVSHVCTNNKNLEFRIYGWLPEKQPINGKVQDILNFLTQIFKDVPWKKRYDSTQKKNVGLLPSEVEDGVCWQDSNLKLLNSCENIQRLFFQKGENQ